VKARRYDWLLLIPLIPLVLAIGLYIATRDRFDAWRYRH
jgi:hypothetical protein